jgi:hypothetical protein
MKAPSSVTTGDRRALRHAVQRYAELASSPENARRIAAWKRHHALRPGRPMLLVFPEGSWRELDRTPAMQCGCTDEFLRSVEWRLRSAIYEWERFEHDKALQPTLDIDKVILDTGWGVEQRWVHSPVEGGARRFDPVVHGPEDLRRMHWPEVIVDEVESQRRLDVVRDAVGDLIAVAPSGIRHLGFHPMNFWTALRGLEEVMIDMVEEPGFLHDAMAFVEEGLRGLVRQWRELGLLELNNDNTYHATGGCGWTDELPARGYTGGTPRLCDLWASAESQELTAVSPEMHAEFAWACERRLLEPFGLTGYGCCDDLTLKLEMPLSLPSMRRVSIAPSASVERCAPVLRNRAIFSWKPNPAHLVGEFQPAVVRRYLRRGMDVAREHGCILEVILKDTHTCGNAPWKFDAWARIAREEIDAVAGPRDVD